MARYPDAADGKQIVGTIVAVSTGQMSQNETQTEKELRRLYMEACKKRWFPPPGEPFDFPPGQAPVLQYRDVVDEEEGIINPNLRGEFDCRRILADADIIIGMASTSGEQFCLYGRDHLDGDGSIPREFKTLVIRLDSENEDTHELEKMCVIIG
jgi:hypothetical protein